MNEKINKMKETCKNFTSFLRMIWILLGIVVVLEAGASIYLAFQSSDNFVIEVDAETNQEAIVYAPAKGYLSVSYSGLIYKNVESNYKISYLISSFITLSQHILVLSILFITYSMLKDIEKEHTPFIPKNTKRLQIIAVLIVTTTVVPSWLELMLNFFIFLEARVKLHPLSSMMVLLGIAIFSISFIFDYGCALQQESDETL